MTFEQMKEIEPGLATLEREVISRNNEAQHKEMYWVHVWVKMKRTFFDCVGFGAQHKELRSSSAYDAAYDYLRSVTTNMK